MTLLLMMQVDLEAQTVEELLTQKKPSCRDLLTNAASVLPQLYAQQSIDSLIKAIGFIDAACPANTEMYYLKILVQIERPSILIPVARDPDFIEHLNSFALLLLPLKNHPGSVYDAEADKLVQLINQWAANLLKKKNLSADDYFFCSVLAGNIKNPEEEILANKDTYPNLFALLKQGYANERNSNSFTTTVIAGAWLPTGNLKALGRHPTLGIAFGTRTKTDELDFTLQIKFLKTPNRYDILRQNTLYSINNFFGGYLGLDYTKYFIHKTGYELGWLAGLGFDGFDITGSTDYGVNNDYLRPLSINSFNFNSGLQFNFFFDANAYIGLRSRYNFVNYANKGGTNLDGNSIAVDLLFGYTKRHNY